MTSEQSWVCVSAESLADQQGTLQKRPGIKEEGSPTSDGQASPRSTNRGTPEGVGWGVRGGGWGVDQGHHR